MPNILPAVPHHLVPSVLRGPSLRAAAVTIVTMRATGLPAEPPEPFELRLDRPFLWAIEHRAITSLAHQAGMDALLLHHLEAALVAEVEAAGLVGDDCADAVRAILVVVTGALVLALRDPTRFPEAYRSGALWAGSDASVAPATRTALRADPDLDALTAATVRAVVDHHVPASVAGPNRSERR